MARQKEEESTFQNYKKSTQKTSDNANIATSNTEADSQKNEGIRFSQSINLQQAHD